MKFKYVVGLGVAAATFATVATPLAVTSVKAEATSDSVESPVSKYDINPVANYDNDSLRQIAINNNLDLSVVEALNDNIDPDKALPNGTLIYLPQNVGSVENVVGPQALGPYDGVPASIKKKYYDSLSSAERSAKLWIAQRESGYNYHATNGKYYGRFQLDRSLLNGDYSIANQEKAATTYIHKRYSGSWVKAKAFWQAHGWY